MFLSDASLKRPIAMTVVLIVLALFGFLALRSVGYDLIPRMDMPYVTIAVVYPGASPEELETAVARRLEDAVTQVDGLKHCTSTCVNNFCQILLEFEHGRDVDMMATEVRAKIDLVRGDLPSGAEPPKVLKYDVNATAVVTMALKGTRDTGELYDFADDRLKSVFSVLSGVASVDLVGGEKREVTIDLDREKLAGAGLTVAEVVQKVGKGNLKLPSGDLDDRGHALSVMFDAEADAAEELGAIELGAPRGAKVYLRDVAKIGFGARKAETLGFCDGERAVLISVTKRGEANALKTVELVREAFERTRAALPAGMELEWVRDDGDFVRASVASGFDSIWQSVLLTGVILLLFLADWRTAFTAFVSIPLTIVIAFVVFPAFGYTFNLITMSAIGITTGILVANSIVVLENVARHVASAPEADTPARMRPLVARAAREIAVAVAASALTNIVVFLPIGTMRSVVGRILSPFAIVITAATFASLLVSFTLTPMLAALLGRRAEGVNRLLGRVLAPFNAFYNLLARLYGATIGAVVKHPWPVTLTIAALTVLAFAWVTPGLQIGFVPTFDKGELTVRLEYPADYALTRSAEKARALAAKLTRLSDAEGRPLVIRSTIAVGKTQGVVGQISSGAYLAEISAVLRPMTERRETLFDIAERVREVCREEPDVRWSVLVPTPVGGAGQQIAMRVRGDDFDELDRIALAAYGELRDDEVCEDVEHSVRVGKPELRFAPRRAVLNDLGLTPDVVGLILRGSLAGIKAGTLSAGGRSFDVRVRLAEEDGEEKLAALNFPAGDGRLLPLAAVASAERRLQRVQISRSDKRRTVHLYSNAAPGYGLATAVDHLADAVDRHLSEGCDRFTGGQAELMEEVVPEFSLVTVIAIVLTYLLLAAVLESWSQPFVILFTVPFSYLGMFAAIRFSGGDLSVFAFLAGIMLVGVVVNAAILLLDERSALIRGGATGAEATLQAANAKFRPILMSCTAALFGMLPMAFTGGFGCELRQSIGIASVGGIVVSSLVSLYFIPALCNLKFPR